MPLLPGAHPQDPRTPCPTQLPLLCEPEALSHWAHAYVRALPLGLCIGLFMGFVVRPWLQARMQRYGLALN